MIAQDVAREIEHAGGSVVGPVPSVDKAVRLVEKAGFDAAVLDVNLGQENSFPIARLLQAQGIPFLFSTGYNSADIPAEWRHVTATMKPLKIADVTRLLGGDQSAQSRDDRGATITS